MSHQPPVPAGNQSPYPIQEAPHKHDVGPPEGAVVAKTPASALQGPDNGTRAVGGGVIGALAAVGIVALVAAGAWAFTRRDDATPSKGKNKRKRAKH